LEPPTAANIETVFRKPAGRFGRNRVRKGLYAKGFPHSFERGLWSATAVADWLASAGRAERMRRTSQSVRPIPSVRSLYGSPQGSPKTLASLKWVNGAPEEIRTPNLLIRS
jgi:hypothetical protein